MSSLSSAVLLRGATRHVLLPILPHCPNSNYVCRISKSGVNLPGALKGSCGAARLHKNLSVLSSAVAGGDRATMVDVAPVFDVFVKGSPEKNELGDCPFSHRTMLTLEEKGIPYEKKLIDEKKIPDWVADVYPAKKIPFMKDLQEDKWIGDSEKMVSYIEEKFPPPKYQKLGKPEEVTDIGSDLMPTFMEFLKSKTPGKDDIHTFDPKREEELKSQLRTINDHLKQKGPYLEGDNVTAADMKLAPQLHHVVVACKNIKNWELPSEFGAVKDYLDSMRSRDSWKKTQYTEKYMVDGWNVKLESMGVK